MSAPKTFHDGNLTKPQAVSQRRFSTPFAGDNTQYVFEADFIQFADKFKPLALDTPDAPKYPAHYCVGESEPQPQCDNVVRWTRTYARIPSMRLDGESYSWTLPGIAVEAIYGQVSINNSAVTTVGAYTRITTLQDHKLTVGAFVQIAITSSFGGLLQQTAVVRRVVRAVLGPLTFDVDIVLDFGPAPFFISVQKIDGGRDPITRVVPSMLQFDYYLPGVSPHVGSMKEIPILFPNVITDGFGKETNTYAAGTAPSKATYLADVAAKSWIVAEASVLRRWKGNIYERVTRFVRAQ
jgi:hypothetical protein